MTNRKTALTRATTTTRRDVKKAMRKAELSREEELVLRLRYGLDEPGNTRLEYRGQDHAEIAAKLAMIEADALAHMRPREATPEEASAVLKSSIIDELRKL